MSSSEESPSSPSPLYPAWSGSRIPLSQALASGGGPVAGRYLRGKTRDLLEDASAVVELPLGDIRPGHGDHVTALLVLREGAAALEDVRVLSPSRREPPPSVRRAAEARPLLEARARILAGVRSFFAARGFLEVETPARVVNPGLEPHLRPFPAGVARDGSQRWLVTSPELHLKKLLCAGYERVFELARCFRDEEHGAVHLSEFTLLEWYRTHAGLDAIADDLRELLPHAASAAGFDPVRVVESCDLTAPFDRATVAEVFRDMAGADVHALDPRRRDEIFVSDVEPYLGTPRPLLLSEYPADAAALSRLVPASDGSGRLVAARMEIYVAGVELGNAFDELTDPDEQRRRHEQDRATRLAAGLPAPELDEDFLAALEAGLPPSAGMALGLDRLVMLLLGRRDVSDARAFAR